MTDTNKRLATYGRIMGAPLTLIAVSSVLLYLQRSYVPSHDDGGIQYVSPIEPVPQEQSPTDSSLPLRARWISGLVKGTTITSPSLPPLTHHPLEAAYVGFRARGVLVHSIWMADEHAGRAIEAAIRKAKAELAAEILAKVDVIELDLCHAYVDCALADAERGRRRASNLHRGMQGLEITCNGITERYAPTAAIAVNRSTKHLLEDFQRRHDFTQAQMEMGARLRTFEAEQLLVRLAEEPSATRMLRGNTLVPLERGEPEQYRALDAARLEMDAHQSASRRPHDL